MSSEEEHQQPLETQSPLESQLPLESKSHELKESNQGTSGEEREQSDLMMESLKDGFDATNGSEMSDASFDNSLQSTSSVLGLEVENTINFNPEFDRAWYGEEQKEPVEKKIVNQKTVSLDEGSEGHEGHDADEEDETHKLRTTRLKSIEVDAATIVELLRKTGDTPQSKLSDKLRVTAERLKRKVREEAKSGQSALRKAVTGDKSKRVRDLIHETRKKPKVIRLIDKIAFTSGILGIILTEFILLRYPQQFWMWYSFVIPLLLFIRYWMYRAEKYLYFLIDFCYFANFVCLAQIFIFPHNETFFYVNFMFSNGPLLWAIVAWRNSLVFHSIDKMTSIFVHVFPGALMFCLRWYPVNEDEINRISEEVSFTKVFLLALFWYLFWQVCYFLKTEFLDKSILDSDPEIQTSLRYLAKDKRNPLHRLLLKMLRDAKVFSPDEHFDSTAVKTKFIFMFAQLVFTILTFLPVPFLFHNFYLHVLFLFSMFSICAYNGAGYYMEVFSIQYSVKFKKE